MRLRDKFAFLPAFVFVAALLIAQGAVAAEPQSITPEEGLVLIKEKENLFILDVRNPNEHAANHYPGSLNIPVNELEERLSEVPTGKPVLVHCGKGMRSARACEILKEKRPDIVELYHINGDTIF